MGHRLIQGIRYQFRSYRLDSADRIHSAVGEIILEGFLVYRDGSSNAQSIKFVLSHLLGQLFPVSHFSRCYSFLHLGYQHQRHSELDYLSIQSYCCSCRRHGIYGLIIRLVYRYQDLVRENPLQEQLPLQEPVQYAPFDIQTVLRHLVYVRRINHIRMQNKSIATASQ